MKFRCPACRQYYDLEIALGQKVECACGNRFWVSADELVQGDDDAAVPPPVPANPQASVLLTAEEFGSRRAPSPKPGAKGGKTWIGRELGHSRIERKVGQGTMGEVFLARHTTLAVPVAVKILHPSCAGDESFVRRFLREARTAAELNHPNVTRIFDCGVSPEGIPYIVMEYMGHGSVDGLLQKQKRLPVAMVLKMAHDVCLALLEAELRGIVHRDVKPANIMLADNGAFKLVDLGLARRINDDKSTISNQLAQTQFGLGTPLYVPPEQAGAAATVDSRADIYALGASMFHLLAGEPPFKAQNLMQLMEEHARLPVPDLSKINPEVTPQLFAVIRRCMAKLPEYRYQSAADLLHDLDVLMRNPAPREALLRAYETELDWNRRAPGRLDRMLPWMIGVLLVLLLATAAVCAMHVMRKRRQESLPVTSVPGTKLPAALTQPEYSAALAMLREEGAQAARRGTLWADICAVAAGKGDPATAFFAAREVFLALREAQPGELKPGLGNTVVSKLLKIRGVDAAVFRAHLNELRGLAGDTFSPDFMLVDQEFADYCRERLGLQGRISLLGAYRVAFEYNFSRDAELLDFHLPVAGWERTADGWREPADFWHVQNGTLRAEAGQGGQSRLLWRIPHGASVEMLAEIEFPAPAGGQWAVLVAAPGAALQFPVPGEKAFRVTEGVSRAEAVLMADERSLAVRQLVPAPSRRREVRLSLDLPRVSVRLDGQDVCSQDFNSMPPQGAAGAGFVGLVLEPGMVIRKLRVHLPVEDLAAAAGGQTRLYCYPAMLQGSGRFDLPSSAVVDSLEVLDPAERIIGQPLALRRILSAPNGEFAAFTAGQPHSPGAMARFAVDRQAVPDKARLQVSCFARFRDAEGRELPGDLEIFDHAAAKWLPLNRISGPLFLERQGIFSEFVLDTNEARRLLSPYGEFVVRLLAPGTAAGNVELNHLLLTGVWGRNE